MGRLQRHRAPDSPEGPRARALTWNPVRSWLSLSRFTVMPGSTTRSHLGQRRRALALSPHAPGAELASSHYLWTALSRFHDILGLSFPHLCNGDEDGDPHLAGLQDRAPC